MQSRVVATETSEQLNEWEGTDRRRRRASEANELTARYQEGWNEAKRRGRTLLLVVYRVAE